MRIIIRYRQRSSRAWAGSGWSKVATQLALRMSRGAIRSGALPTAALPNGELPRKHRFPSITLGQHQLNFSARWATQPPAKACAFERRSDTGKARTVFDALSLQQRQCKGAMEDVTGNFLAAAGLTTSALAPGGLAAGAALARRGWLVWLDE